MAFGLHHDSVPFLAEHVVLAPSWEQRNILDITLGSLLKVSGSFGETYRLHCQDRRINQDKYQHERKRQELLHWHKLNTVTWVCERTISTERQPLIGEVSAKFGDRGCYVFSVTDPYGLILSFLDRSRYFFFQVASQMYSQGCVVLGIEFGLLDPKPVNLTTTTEAIYFLLHNVYKFSSYLTGSTIHLRCVTRNSGH
jgi:hypothetical protein